MYVTELPQCLYQKSPHVLLLSLRPIIVVDLPDLMLDHGTHPFELWQTCAPLRPFVAGLLCLFTSCMSQTRKAVTVGVSIHQNPCVSG